MSHPSWWYLFGISEGMNQGGICCGIAFLSSGWNCASSLIEYDFFHSVPSFSPCEKNFRLPRILMKVSPGMPPLPLSQILPPEQERSYSPRCSRLN